MTDVKEKIGLGQNGVVDKESVEVKAIGKRSFEASSGLDDDDAAEKRDGARREAWCLVGPQVVDAHYYVT
jgi:hypothetical protein